MSGIIITTHSEHIDTEQSVQHELFDSWMEFMIILNIFFLCYLKGCEEKCSRVSKSIFISSEHYFVLK